MLVCVFSPSGGSERPQKGEASDEDEDTEYFDAMEDSPAFITVTATENTQHRSVSQSRPWPVRQRPCLATLCSSHPPKWIMDV